MNSCRCPTGAPRRSSGAYSSEWARQYVTNAGQAAAGTAMADQTVTLTQEQHPPGTLTPPLATSRSSPIRKQPRKSLGRRKRSSATCALPPVGGPWSRLEVARERQSRPHGVALRSSRRPLRHRREESAVLPRAATPMLVSHSDSAAFGELDWAATAVRPLRSGYAVPAVRVR